MLLLLYEYPHRRINCCLQLTSETVPATCRVNVIKFFFSECSFCTLLHLLFITCYPTPLSPFPTTLSYHFQSVCWIWSRLQGRSIITSGTCVLVCIPRHLCFGVSERRICSPEVGTELFNQTNHRHARSDRGKTQKNLSRGPRCPNWDRDVVEHTYFARDTEWVNFLGPHKGKLIQRMINAPLIC
jgi:hypothetical protein